MRPRDIWQDPSVTLAGNVDEKMVVALDKWAIELLKVKPRPASAVIRISSNGGQSFIGMGLFDRIGLLNRIVPITVVGIGAVCSAALTMAMAVPKSKRFLTRQTMVMFHPTQHDVNIPYGGSLGPREQHIQEITEALKVQRRHHEWVMHLIARDSKRSLKAILEMARRNTYLLGPQAVRFGLFAGLVKSR